MDKVFCLPIAISRCLFFPSRFNVYCDVEFIVLERLTFMGFIASSWKVELRSTLNHSNILKHSIILFGGSLQKDCIILKQ